MQINQVTQQTRGPGLPFLEDIATLFTAQNGSVSNNLNAVAASGALPLVPGSYFITKAGVAALTLAAPIAGSTGAGQDGSQLCIYSTTAYAHTLTTSGLLQTGSASVNTATFAAFAGASLTLVAYNGKWLVLTSNGITFS
jgi:uncharacterized membrane protein YjjP (DUF1212 family)